MYKISVVIPVKNREKVISRAINSVLNQVDVFTEIIVVDDGSTDDTVRVVGKKFPNISLLINQKSKGAAIARNYGAKHASFDFIAFLDSDDQWKERHLIQSIDLMESRAADGSYCYFDNVKHNIRTSIKFNRNKRLTLLENILASNNFDCRTSTFIFRTNAFERILFDEKLKKFQDWDLASRFDKEFKFICKKRNDVILNLDVNNRMSNSYNLSAFNIFYQKHERTLNPNIKVEYIIKAIRYAYANKENKCYLMNLLTNIPNKNLTIKHKFLKIGVVSRLLSVNNIYYIYKVISGA